MRFWSYKKWVAMAAAVFCFVGSGAVVSVNAAYGMEARETEACGTEACGTEARETEACGTEACETEACETEAYEAAVKTGISWWICPTGGYADEEQVRKLVAAYEEKNPQVTVDVRILDEENGAEEIDKALGTVDGPDVVLAAPEDIVTRWGAEGFMEDLSDLWDEETQKEFRAEMRDTAKNREGVWYAVPVFRDIFTMAINYDVFQKAGALQYLNEEVHSWKDSGFIDAVLRVHDVLLEKNAEGSPSDGTNALENAADKVDSKDSDSHKETLPGVVGRVYCKDKTGQRAMMCFVSNFFNTGLVDEYHSSYQINRGKIRDVFSTLRRLQGKGIEYDAEMDGTDENEAFLAGDVYLTFNWSAAKQRAAMGEDGDGRNAVSFHVFPIMYPNSKNLPFLTGTVGALGVTRKDAEDDTAEEDTSAGGTAEAGAAEARAAEAGTAEEDTAEVGTAEAGAAEEDTSAGGTAEAGAAEAGSAAALEARKEAAVSFVHSLMADEDLYREAVLLSGCFPARRRIQGHELRRLYGDDRTMALYETLNEYYGDYEPVMELYPELEDAWPGLLQEIGEGAKIKRVMKKIENELNGKLEEEYGILPIDTDSDMEMQG